MDSLRSITVLGAFEGWTLDGAAFVALARAEQNERDAADHRAELDARFRGRSS